MIIALIIIFAIMPLLTTLILLHLHITKLSNQIKLIRHTSPKPAVNQQTILNQLKIKPYTTEQDLYAKALYHLDRLN